MKNYYKILETHPKATEEEIKSAYRACAKKYHPDTNQTNKEYFHALFVEINEAYQILSDDILRKEYDVKFNFYYSTLSEEVVIVKEEIFRPKDRIDIVDILRTIPFFKNKFEINYEFITWKKHRTWINEIDNIKFGLQSILFSSPQLFLSFKTSSGNKIFINFSEPLVPQDYLTDKYNNIVELINYYLYPNCLSRLISKLDAGKIYVVTKSIKISRTGLILNNGKYNLVKWENLIIKETSRNYYNYKYVSNYLLSDKLNRRIKVNIKPHKNWNACLIPSIRNFYSDFYLVKTGSDIVAVS